MFVVVLTGPPGSGKTTVLTALQNVLADDELRHAVIELEALAWAYPPLDDDHAFEQLAQVRHTYADAGYQLLLCGATITSEAYMTRLFATLAAEGRLLVRLEATPETLTQRIIEREPPGWSGLAELLDAATEIAATSRGLPNVDVVCSTMDRSPEAIAEMIRSARPEVLRPSPQSPDAS